MIEIWAVLVPILITDILNPVLFAVMVYAAGSKHLVVNSSAILLGHTLAYFGTGIIMALGLERITHRLANPQMIDFIIGLFIGVVLLWVAFSSRKKSKERRTEYSGILTPLKALGLGVIVSFVGTPFGLPYFAALDQILKANLPMSESLVVLAGYNMLYALPFVIVPVLTAILGERSRALLQRISDVLDRLSSYLAPVLFFLVGSALVIDAIMYFATGEGLF